MGNLLVVLLLLATIALKTNAFVSLKVLSSASPSGEFKSNSHFGYTNVFVPFSSSSSSSLSLMTPSHRNGNNGEVFPKARTDIRNFLTQRSIQSFVYLLNQCREEHIVRWLEKSLDFPSIDNFHGTGAFNQTKFPEWDSIFLDYVDHPEEVIVIQMRQRRRQRKLSGHNTYFESLKSSVGKKVKDKSEDGTNFTETTKNRAFSTTRNYLDVMNPKAKPPSIAKKSQISVHKVSSSSNYLDSISPLPMNKKNPKKTSENEARLTNERSEKNPKVTSDENKSKKSIENLSEKSQKKKESQNLAFGPGKSSTYMQSLSAMSNNRSSDGLVEKAKQSSETSKNPFLDEKTKEFELSIDPPALVRRILSVRELLSKEWVEDLDMLMKLNDEITESFEEYNNESMANDGDAHDDDDDYDTQMNFCETKPVDKYDGESSNDFDELLNALVTPFHKETNPDSSSVYSNSSLEKNEGKVIDDEETCQNVFNLSNLSAWTQALWTPNRSSSPYRKANFDLLLLLATQESIHRVLNSYNSDSTVRPEIYEWLFKFYGDTVNEYFDGHQTYARSEDFLEKMLNSPRTLIETNNEILAWINPAIVAEDIVRERSEVALGWMKIAENILDEHTDLRRLLFTNMVSKSFPDESLSDTILTAVKEEQGEDSKNSPSEVFGAFE